MVKPAEIPIVVREDMAHTKQVRETMETLRRRDSANALDRLERIRSQLNKK